MLQVMIFPVHQVNSILGNLIVQELFVKYFLKVRSLGTGMMILKDHMVTEEKGNASQVRQRTHGKHLHGELTAERRIFQDIADSVNTSPAQSSARSEIPGR